MFLITTLLVILFIGDINSLISDAKSYTPEDIEWAGLAPVSVPVLAQLPMDINLRERQIAEFEKIKAGF